MAVAVHERTREARRAQVERETLGRALADDELLERERRGRERLGLGAGQERPKLVAQAEHARGLEADDRDAARDLRRERGAHARGLRARLLDHARREIRAAAAERPFAAARDLGPVAGRREHAHGRAQVLGLEIRIECVGEQHDVARRVAGAGRRSPRGRGHLALAPEPIAPPARQRAARREPRNALRQRREPRHAVAEVQQRRERGRAARVTRQMRDELVV